MATLRVDRDYFIKRATRIYEAWNDESNEVLAGVESLVFMVGESKDEVQYSKSSALQTWLFNCSLPDTLLVLTKSGIYFLGSDRKAQFFSPLDTKENLHPIVPPFTIMNRDKKDKDKKNFEKLLDIILAEGKSCGHFTRDKPTSEFAQSWDTALKGKSQTFVDVASAFARIFAVKDEKELELVKKSASASVNGWLHLRKRIVDVVDTEKKIRHNRLCEDLEKAMVSVQVQGNLSQPGILDTCYAPIIQSGDNCTLKFSAESNDKLVHFNSVVNSLGARYASYCSNVGRTLLVMPSPEVEDLYETLLSTELAIIEALKPGKKVCDAYAEGIRHFKERKPNYLQYLTKGSFGFATGIEFRDANLLINEKCKQTVAKGMTFIIAVGLENFPAKDGSFSQSAKAASLYLSDTILVCDNGPNEVLTERARSRLRANAIRMRSADEVDGDAPSADNDAAGRSKRTVVLQEQTRHKQTNEEKRLLHQRDLAEQLNKDARERLSLQPGAKQAQKAKKSTVSYKGEDKFPDDSEVEKLLIFVDKRSESVIIPIFGVPVPFHVSMIKNISQTVEGDFTYLRINFTHPGSIATKQEGQLPGQALLKFIKELTFKSSNMREAGEVHSPSTNLTTAHRLIKEMQKRYRTAEAEEREKEGALKQDKLVLSIGKPNPKLKDLNVRPYNIIPKRINGTLEAHTNGFRFTSIRNDKIDLLYNNIKHAFFQPCDNEMLILLHFHLKYPVLWGKKKHSDIQFYTEVGEVNTDLGKYHHMQDRDDIQSEQMEREMRKKLNLAFENFCDKVRRMTNDVVDFDVPFGELAFTGVPHRSSVQLKPSSSCLVHLTEWPPFIVTLDEIELVHFERVTSNTKSFDMVIVFKDYHRKVQQVGHIPSNSLDAIKDWLNSCDIRYSEGPMSLNWNNILKTIIDDPDSFFESGGWKFILQEDEDEEEEEEEESEFEPTSDESEEEDDDDDEEGESPSATSDDESEADVGSDESEGKDWSDLEEEAARADKAKDTGEDERDRDRDRKRKGGKGHAPSAKRRK